VVGETNAGAWRTEVAASVIDDMEDVAEPMANGGLDAYGFELVTTDEDDDDEAKATVADDSDDDEGATVDVHGRHRHHQPGRALPARDRQGPAADGRAGGVPRQAHRARRRRRPPPADRGEPAPRRVDRQALRRARHALPGSHPGGQPRPDARRREVRLAPR